MGKGTIQHKEPGARRSISHVATWGLVLATAALVVIAVVAAMRWRDATLAGQPRAGRGAPDARLVHSSRSDGEATVPIARTHGWRDLDDPGSDGWDTEVFNEKAQAQLKKLGKLITHPEKISADAVAPLAAEEFACASLVPSDVETVFEDQALQVERERIESDSPQAEETLRGPGGLASALRALTKPIGEATDRRVKFKLFRVETAPPTVTTRQYFAVSGRTKDGVYEQNATWVVRWVPGADGTTPKIASIRVEDFEQVIPRGAGGTLFADCTEAVLGHNACYLDQLLIGFDHWLETLQETRYYSILGKPGLAVGDVDGDGLDDLYFCQEAGLPNRLFLQQTDGTADEASQHAQVDWLESTRSALLVDLDNDGNQDLVAATVGGLVLAAGDGRGRFEIRKVLPTSDDAMSLAAADYDNDGDLDLYVCVYYPSDFASEADDSGVAIPAGEFVYHDANNGGANSLIRNEGDWKFNDVTQEVGLDVNNRRFSLAAAWEDFDNDGDQDLYVANDYGRNNLYRNEGGSFVDVAAGAGVEDSASGMSVTWGDYDRDGRADVYVSNMFSAAGNRITFQEGFKAESTQEVKSRLQRFARGNTLLANLGDGTFGDVSAAAAVTMGRWAWGSNFCDLNNDGWDDLIVANGYITTEDTGDL